MQDVIEQLKRLNRIRTSETYSVTLASFMKFRDGQDILLCEIDSDAMMLYEAWLKANSNCPNTISFYMRILRAVYNRAVEKDLIEQKFPFKHVYTGIDKTMKRAVPLKTIKRIKELDLTTKSHLDYARDMFPLFVLHPWNVVCRYGIPEKVGLEKWNPHLPEKKDRTAAYRQVGEVHGGYCG